MWLTYLFISLVSVLIYKIFFAGSKSKSEKAFLRRHGIPEVDTSKAVNLVDVFIFGKSISVGDKVCYGEMSRTGDKFCWTTELGTPRIVIKDMEVAKKVMIKDFDHFADRRQFFNDSNSLLRLMLVTLEGDEWKGVRSAVSPTFTTGKIRRMMEYFNSVGLEWVTMLKEKSKARGHCTVDALQTVNQYTVDVIAAAVFGMKAGTVEDANSIFARMATKITDMPRWKIAKFTMSMVFPTFFKLLNVPLIDPEAMTFFEKILDKGLKERMSSTGTGPKRNDFLQLLVEAKKGDLKAEGSDELSTFEKDAQIKSVSSDKQKISQYLTEDIMNAQSLLFFVAGFSTTSTFITFMAYCLAAYQDVQEKLRKEIETIADKDGNLPYDELGTLPYMDMVCNETLRKFPAADRVERICTKDYKDPETGLAAKKGMLVGFPISQVHQDPKYYERPNDFYPEHFTPEKKTERSPYAFAPFGTGPRNCIGK